MEPTKDQMYQWYVVEQKSFRQIMKLIGTGNNRKIPKLLKEYNIPIRHGSEAVKTQWVNNEERRSQIGNIFSEYHSGKESHRRLTDKEIEERLKDRGISLQRRYFKDGYTWMDCKCNQCGREYSMNLKKLYGCANCERKKNADKQRLSFEVVEAIFNNNGFILIDTEYKKNTTPMACICVNHASDGIQYRSLEKVRSVGKCKRCKIEEKRENRPVKDREKYSYEVKRWREAVFKRDNYTCQCCRDSKGGNLQAHHIKNFLTYKHLRFDIDNGITLCQSCHDPKIIGSFHHTYGTYNNTEEQLKQYIENKQQQFSIL